MDSLKSMEVARPAGLKVNYAIGDSAGMGLAVEPELDVLGDCLESLHLKDKLRGGTSVPLGRGDSDFPALGPWLRRAGFDGDLVLKAARGPEGEEISWTLGYRRLLDRILPASDPDPAWRLSHDI